MLQDLWWCMTKSSMSRNFSCLYLANQVQESLKIGIAAAEKKKDTISLKDAKQYKYAKKRNL